MAEFFRRAKNAKVEENIKVVGNSGTTRQLDVLVTVPVKITFGLSLDVTVNVKIFVDAKERDRPVAIGIVDEVDGLRDDVGAHLAIIASPLGFTKGAINRCKQVSVYPLTVTSDLLFMLYGKRVPDDLPCLAACDPAKGRVKWGRAITILQPRFDYVEEDKGLCVNCNTLHVTCSDCAAVFAVTAEEIGQPIECPGKCGRVTVFFPPTIPPSQFATDTIESHDILDCMLMKDAYEANGKRLSPSAVRKLIRKTKWQYFAADESPTIGLTEVGLMEWSTKGLVLTDDGIRAVDEVIRKAKYPKLAPAMIPLTLPPPAPVDPLDAVVFDDTSDE